MQTADAGQTTEECYRHSGSSQPDFHSLTIQHQAQTSNHAEQYVSWHQTHSDPAQRQKDGAAASQWHCAIYAPVVLFPLVELLFSSPNICLSSLPLLMDLHWYSVGMGALRVKLDTELLNILLKSFPGITGWAAYNTDLTLKAATALWFMLFWYLSEKRASRHLQLLP